MNRKNRSKLTRMLLFLSNPIRKGRLPQLNQPAFQINCSEIQIFFSTHGRKMLLCAVSVCLFVRFPLPLFLLFDIDDRYRKKALIISSQLAVNDWYAVIGNELIAESCLDRIVHKSIRFQLKGESLRKKY